MRPAVLALVGLLLAPQLAWADYPRGPERDRRENTAWGPLEVCSAMVAAANQRQYDDLLAHTSSYARARVGFVEKVALRLARSRIANSTCVSYTKQDRAHATVSMRNKNGETSPMPFVLEQGVWRFDQFRWEQLRRDGKAAKP